MKKTPPNKTHPATPASISRGLFLATVAFEDKYNAGIAGYILENETFRRLMIELAEKQSISKEDMMLPSFLLFKSEGARDVYVFAESTIANMNLYDLVAGSTHNDEQQQTH